MRLFASFLLAFFIAADLHAAITGSVIDIDGKPLANAAVTAHRLESSQERMVRLLSPSPMRKAIASTVTNDAGSFRVDGKEEPVIDLVILADGYEPVAVRAEANEDALTISLRRAAQKVGYIKADGKPVPGAVVVWSISWGSTEFVSITDAEGRYTAPDPHVWAHHFIVLHPRYASRDSRSERLVFNKDSSIDVTLDRGVSVAGLITGADGKTAVGGAKLRLDGWPAGETAADGTFRIERAPRSWHWIEAERENLAGGRTRSDAATYAIKLSAASPLQGTVVDSVTERGIASAEVQIWSAMSRRLESVIADRDGTFASPPLLAADGLRLVHPAYVSHEQPLVLRSKTDHLFKASPLVRVSGIVVDEKGLPVAAALIGRNRGGMPVGLAATSRSGRDGRFSVRLYPMPTVEIEASRKGFLPARKALPRGGEASPVRLVLTKGVDVAIRVKDEDGKPIPDVAVNAGALGDEGQKDFYACRDAQSCSTDADGLLLLALKPGRHSFAFRRPGFVARELPDVDIASGQKPIDVVLSRGVEIAGVVTYADRSPAAGILVSASGADARTEDDGTFVIRGVAAGKTSVRLQHPGSHVQVPAQEVTAPAKGVAFEIPRLATIRGRVIDRETGAPIGVFRAAVGRVKDDDGRTTGIMSHGPSWLAFADDRGTFTLDDVPPGDVEVLASSEGYLSGRIEVAVAEEKMPDEIEIALERGVRLSGRVVSEEGEPLEGIQVMVKPNSWRNYAEPRPAFTTTDEAGAFSLENLAPEELAVSAFKSGRVSTQQSVVLKKGLNEIELQMARGHEVAVKVIDESGRPVDGASVSMRTLDGTTSGTSERTDESGLLTIRNARAGLAKLFARKEGLISAETPVEIGTAREATLTLLAGGVITGRLIGLEPEEIGQTFVNARSNSTGGRVRIEADGRYRITGVPEGMVTVSASARSRRSDEKVVEIRSGSTIDVDLTFERGIAISGEVTSAGKGIRAMLVFAPREKGRNAAYAQSFETGRYEAYLPMGGEYRVTVTGLAGGMVEETHHFTSDTTRDFNLLQRIVRGKVVDASTGEPLADAAVTIRSADTRAPNRSAAETNVRGEFEIRAGDGPHVVFARKPGFGHGSKEVAAGNFDAAVEDIRLQRADGVVVKAVDAATGAPLGVFISVFDERNRFLFDHRSPWMSAAATIPLAPGNYFIQVGASNNYLNKRVRVVSPSEVTVPLDPAARVVVILRAAGLLSVLNAADAKGYRAMPRPPGAHTFGYLRPGTYTVSLTSESGEPIASRTVTLAAGVETRVDLP